MATGTIKISVKLTGLGEDVALNNKFDVTTAPTAATYNYRTLATADTAEALDLGDVSTAHLICLKAIGGDLEIDTSYDTSFNAELIVHDGEVAVFKPNGTVYVKNQDTGETPSYEYLVLGET